MGKTSPTVKLATIKAEMARLEQFISADTVIRNQYTALSSRIAQENNALKTLEMRLTDAQGAAARRKALQTEREASYGRVFDAIISEQNVLVALYAPLMARLANSSGTLRKLSFSVSRVVDANAWADFAEDELIDCRKSGPFYGRGSLTALANSELKPAWETGSAVEIQTAMADFIAKYWKDLLKHAPYVPTQKLEFRTWLKQFAQWLFSTDHITVRYEISYDGVDIRKLSPGTRGIVLLLLYLALDDADDRPLIIDQPEENLDPKSVFDELVSLFITAKTKRQVIMVTHNANLVINTDADQIIIASAGSHPTGGLPPITYVAGGLGRRQYSQGGVRHPRGWRGSIPRTCAAPSSAARAIAEPERPIEFVIQSFSRAARGNHRATIAKSLRRTKLHAAKPVRRVELCLQDTGVALD